MNLTLTELLTIIIIVALMGFGVYWLESVHSACEDLGGVLYKGNCIKVDIIEEYDR